MKVLLKITFPVGGFPKSPVGNRQSAIALLLALLFSVLTLDLATAQSPTLIPYQGRLTNPQGVPYTNGQYTLAFTLYDQPVGGTVIWGPETHYRVGVINGMVNVFLGSINAISNVDFSQTRHLGITIYADNNPNNPAPEMVPRQMIIPAFWAKNSEKLNGYDWTSIFNVNSPVGPIPGGKIQSQTIMAGQIANNTITAAQIANATITSQQLAGAIITSNQIVNGSIGSANIAPHSVGTLQLAPASVTLTNLAPRPVGTNVGIGGVAVSASTGSFNTSSSTDVAVPNLTVTLATTGRPVIAFLAADESVTNLATLGALSSGNSVTIFQLSLYRGSTKLYQVQQGANPGPTQTIGTYNSPSGFNFIDLNAPAGTNTYSIYVSANGDTVNIRWVKMVAFELSPEGWHSFGISTWTPP